MAWEFVTALQSPRNAKSGLELAPQQGMFHPHLRKETPAEEVTPAYLASLRSEVQALIGTKAARKSAKEV